MRRVLAAADALGIAAVLGLLAFLDAIGVSISEAPVAPASMLIAGPVAIVAWTILATAYGMYHSDERRIETSVADEVGRVTMLGAAWAWVPFLVDAITASGTPSVLPALALWLLMIPAVLTARGVARRWATGRDWYWQRALLLGNPRDTEVLAAIIARHPEYGIEVAAEMELADPQEPDRAAALVEAVHAARVDRVMLPTTQEGLDERTGALRTLAEEGIKVDLVPGDSEIFRSDAELHFVEGVPILTLPSTEPPRSMEAIKRALDIVVSGTALLVLSPLFAYWAARIKLDSPGPVFFRQRRIGHRGQAFEVFKFRTMIDGADDRKHEVAELNVRTDGMFKITDDPRITRYGAKLRRRSIDELPQLINVLRGEMSLVGPRPLIQEESRQVDEHYRVRFEVRPGMTGPWQVMGRSEIPFRKMLKLDYSYVINWSLGDDLKLLVRTVSAITDGRGAY
jgi:exopolysaccharide biosynthesis polyprenyl glycosylphosphotransferase